MYISSQQPGRWSGQAGDQLSNINIYMSHCLAKQQTTHIQKFLKPVKNWTNLSRGDFVNNWSWQWNELPFFPRLELIVQLIIVIGTFPFPFVTKKLSIISYQVSGRKIQTRFTRQRFLNQIFKARFDEKKGITWTLKTCQAWGHWPRHQPRQRTIWWPPDRRWKLDRRC